MSTFRTARRLAMVGVATALVAVIPGGASNADRTYPPVELIEADLGLTSDGDPEMLHGGTMSDNGRYAVVTNGVGKFFHVDLATADTTLLEVVSAVPTDDGQYVIGTDRDGTGQRLREEVGTLDPRPFPFVSVEIGLDPTTWGPANVVDETDDGRYVLLASTTNDNFLTRYFVYDTVDAALMTSIDGLPAPEDGNRRVDVDFDADGTTVSYRSFCCVGASWASFERLNFVTGDRETVTMPTEHVPGLRNWEASPNLEWALFSSNEADVIPGLDAAERLYRRHVDSGATTVIPVDFDGIRNFRSFDVFDDGHVLFTADMPYTGVEETEEFQQVFTWSDADDEAVKVSMGVDGQGARPFGVDSVGWTADGNRIMFTSFATNLVPGITMPDDGDDLIRRLYLVDLDTPPATVGAVQGPVSATAPAVRCGDSC